MGHRQLRQQKPEVKYHHITETWKISIKKK